MTIKQRVEAILKVSRMARNSDKELQIIYIQKAGMELTPDQVELFKTLPSMETIRRTRQQIQEEGKYPADSEVEKERYNKYVNTKQNIKSQSPEQLLESRGYRVKPWGEE